MAILSGSYTSDIHQNHIGNHVGLCVTIEAKHVGTWKDRIVYAGVHCFFGFRLGLRTGHASFPGLLRPHKHKDLTLWFLGRIQGGYQKPWILPVLRVASTSPAGLGLHAWSWLCQAQNPKPEASDSAETQHWCRASVAGGCFYTTTRVSSGFSWSAAAVCSTDGSPGTRTRHLLIDGAL